MILTKIVKEFYTEKFKFLSALRKNRNMMNKPPILMDQHRKAIFIRIVIPFSFLQKHKR